ncbi:hypothetical protein AMJ57_01620 [Parcubacteria bacterium SG8_24]|nr:MAG: hypothetical protein AMJ57_01620 [Parcubacteria bacterium SG8_24]
MAQVRRVCVPKEIKSDLLVHGAEARHFAVERPSTGWSAHTDIGGPDGVRPDLYLENGSRKADVLLYAHYAPDFDMFWEMRRKGMILRNKSWLVSDPRYFIDRDGHGIWLRFSGEREGRGPTEGMILAVRLNRLYDLTFLIFTSWPSEADETGMIEAVWDLVDSIVPGTCHDIRPL